MARPAERASGLGSTREELRCEEPTAVDQRRLKWLLRPSADQAPRDRLTGANQHPRQWIVTSYMRVSFCRTSDTWRPGTEYAHNDDFVLLRYGLRARRRLLGSI